MAIELPKIISHYNLSLVNTAKNYLGKISEISLPDIERTVLDWKAGGLDTVTAIPLGIEKMEASFTIKEFDIDMLRAFGLANGSKATFDVSLNMTSAPQDAKQFKAICGGLITKIEFGSITGGGEENLVISQTLDYFKLDIDRQNVYLIDNLNLKRTINGVDEMEQVRANLGVS